jgi:hypothetical protein
MYHGIQNASSLANPPPQSASAAAERSAGHPGHALCARGGGPCSSPAGPAPAGSARGGVCTAAKLALSPVSPYDGRELSPFCHGPDVLGDALPPASEILRMLESGAAVRGGGGGKERDGPGAAAAAAAAARACMIQGWRRAFDPGGPKRPASHGPGTLASRGRRAAPEWART